MNCNTQAQDSWVFREKSCPRHGLMEMGGAKRNKQKSHVRLSTGFLSSEGVGPRRSRRHVFRFARCRRWRHRNAVEDAVE
jgi:hypothetical protein